VKWKRPTVRVPLYQLGLGQGGTVSCPDGYFVDPSGNCAPGLFPSFTELTGISEPMLDLGLGLGAVVLLLIFSDL
jgi:hypothetical protein